MSKSEKLATVIITAVVAFIISIAFLTSCTSGGVAIKNLYVGQIKEVDNLTNYETKKNVEDTCRALVVSYHSDELMYQQYKDSDNTEERSWASAAKIRANKTAVQYNEFILKNNYVWNGNIPADIKTELPIIE